jgi:hypothetical protein
MPGLDYKRARNTEFNKMLKYRRHMLIHHRRQLLQFCPGLLLRSAREQHWTAIHSP